MCDSVLPSLIPPEGQGEDCKSKRRKSEAFGRSMLLLDNCIHHEGLTMYIIRATVDKMVNYRTIGKQLNSRTTLSQINKECKEDKSSDPCRDRSP